MELIPSSIPLLLPSQSTRSTSSRLSNSKLSISFGTEGNKRNKHRCANCGNFFALKMNGTVRSHRSGGEICNGSGKSPADTITTETPISSALTLSAPGHIEEESTEYTTPTPASVIPHESHSPASRIKLDDSQRERILRAEISTAVVLEYANRCGKAVRAAMVPAAFDSNFDPLLVLKIVLSSSPPRRRGELHKRLLDAFFAADVDTLINKLNRTACPARKTRNATRRRVNDDGADASAWHLFRRMSAFVCSRARRPYLPHKPPPVNETCHV